MHSFLLFFGVALSTVPLVIFGCSELWFSSDMASDTNRPNIRKRSVSSPARESCQTPNVVGNRVNTTDRLRRLRLRMKASGYDAYIVPSIDEHQSRMMTNHDKRREFISGFTGSAGTAVILSESAALWTDGRYFIQAEQELDCNWILMKRYQPGVPEPDDWIIQVLGEGGNVGVDPKLFPYNVWITLKEKLGNKGLNLMADISNLIDDIWDIPQGREPESIAHVFIHDIKYAGQPWEDKARKLREILDTKGANGTVLTALDEIAWFFNLRGNDVADTPLFKAYSFISSNQIRLYIKPLKLTPEVEKHLCPNSNGSECVKLEDYTYAFGDMEKVILESGKILVSSSSSYAVANLVPEKNRIIDSEPSPIALMKTVKNPVEIKGMKNAALKDSVAIVDFIAMLEQQVKRGKHWDEIKAAKTLLEFRKEQEGFQGESFTTISAVGPNGAIIHYHPQIISNRNINTKDLYLLDSGGQYLDGTTDITRTFHFGTPSEFEKAAYTRVLMGAIDLITAVFPNKIKDSDLDIIARLPLFQIGLDYVHGTGHGIGHFLGVHEGPISISPRAVNGKGHTLEPGMFLSDEPGYYENGKFGIRLETMMMVIKAHVPHSFNDMNFYTFEPVSFVPFEPKLIDLKLLSTKQKQWLNRFNEKTRNTVGVELQKQGRERGLRWLLSRTEHIPVNNCRNRSPGGAKAYYLVVLCLATLVFW